MTETDLNIWSTCLLENNMNDIKYNEWAENLLQEIYYAPEEQRVAVIHEHLLKAAKRGYTDGSNNAWWREQEKSMYFDEEDQHG